MRLVLSLMLLILVLMTANAYASEHAVWPMFKHDERNSGAVPYEGAQDALLRWKFSTGNRIQSSASIGPDGTVYVGSFDNNLYAINPDGSEKWRFTATMPIDSTPGIGLDGTIYFGSWDRFMYAVDPSGKGKWKVQASNQISSSPTIGPDGTIYIGADDGFVYAINPNQTMRWSFPTGERIFSTPALSPDGTLYVGSFDNNLYAINPDGSEKWRFVTNGFIFSSPAVSSDGTVYFGSYDANVYALYPNGTMKWIFVTGGIVQGSPSIGPDGTLYVGSFDNNLYAINPDGSEKWRFATGDLVVSSPAIDSDGTVYVGSVDTFLYAINPDGSEKWRFKTDARIFSSPAIDSQGNVYIGSVDGSIYSVGKLLNFPSLPVPREGDMRELLRHGETELYVTSVNTNVSGESNEATVEVIIRNTDSQPRSFDPASFTLVDTSDKEYSANFEKSTIRNVRIQTNDVMHGTLYFSLDQMASIKELVYQDARGTRLVADLTEEKMPPDPSPSPSLMPGSNAGKKMIGETLELTILDEEFSPDRQKYVVRMSLTNKAEFDVAYNKTNVYVKDAKGQVFLPDSSVSFSGTLQPGQTVSGQLIFTLSDDNIENVVLVYDDMATNSFFVVPEFPIALLTVMLSLSLAIFLNKFRNQKEYRVTF